MKKVVFIPLLAILCSALNLMAQSNEKLEKELSKTEQFSLKTGTLIEKRFIDIGSINKAEIQVMIVKNLESGDSIVALRMEYNFVSNYSSDTKIAVLDSDEIEGLINSLKLIQEKVLPSAVSNYTEIIYRSRSGFEAGCYWNKNSWSPYLKLEKFDRNSYVYMKSSDIPMLIALITNAYNYGK